MQAAIVVDPYKPNEGTYNLAYFTKSHEPKFRDPISWNKVWMCFIAYRDYVLFILRIFTSGFFPCELISGFHKGLGFGALSPLGFTF